MNERILELARQVWPDPNTSHVNHEKFAELIVKECVTICQYNADDDDDQFDLGRIHQAKEITHLIKKHFGVEE